MMVTKSCLLLLAALRDASSVSLRGNDEAVEVPNNLDADVNALDQFMKGPTTTAPAAFPSMPTDDGSTLSISELLASAKWPAKDNYEQAFNTVVHGAAGNGCSAPLLARSRLSPYGMGAHFNQFANEVELAMYSGKPIALCAPPSVRDAWAKYFQDPGFSKCETCDWGAGPRQYREMGWDVSDSPDHTQMADVKRFIYGKLFTLSYEAKTVVDSGLQSLGLQGSYVGVHVRRGDKSQEVPLVPLERFTSAITDMCSQLGTTTVFLASDDASTHQKLQEQLGSKYTVVEQQRLSEDAYKLRGDASRSMTPPFGEEDEERSVLIDVGALVRSAGYIGTASSNIDRLVYFQRDPSAPSVSLDEGGVDGFITLSGGR